jgi:predicted AAA+ superfamily ATPase
MDFPEEVSLIRLTSPYFANITKRLVKTPRGYWRDSGLLHALKHCRPQRVSNEPDD